MSYSNCAVAESDFQAALSAIESTFQSGLQQTSEDDAIAHKLMEETHVSLIKSLKRVVHPMADQEYHDIIDPYHIIPADDESEDEEEDDEVAESISKDEGEEIDEEDLLDIKAYETAKEKREQVRNLTRRVQQIRQRVLDRVAKEASKDFQVDSSTSVRVEESEDLTADVSEDSSSFKTSLERLNRLLDQSQWENVPKQLQRLQDTIESVQKEQEKDTPLSQTEIAIVSRTNSMADEELLDQCVRLSQQDYDATANTENDENKLSPVDRLALFFQDYSQ